MVLSNSTTIVYTILWFLTFLERPPVEINLHYFVLTGHHDTNLRNYTIVCVCLSLHPLGWAHSLWRFLGPQLGLLLRYDKNKVHLLTITIYMAYKQTMAIFWLKITNFDILDTTFSTVHQWGQYGHFFFNFFFYVRPLHFDTLRFI